MTAKQGPRREPGAGEAFGGATQILEPTLPNHEPSAWFREVESRRLAQMDAILAEHPAPPGVTCLILAITRHTRHGEREDRTCDRCRTFCGPGEAFEMIAHQPRPGVWLVGGLCAACLALEGVA